MTSSTCCSPAAPKPGATLIIITHDTQLAQRCDRIVDDGGRADRQRQLYDQAA